MNEPLSLSEFIRQILGAELSETQKRILNYLQADERAESIRALFGQLKLKEADQLNTWVRDYEAYVIRHQGEWTDSYRQMRDSLAEYSQERIQEALDKKVSPRNFNGSFGMLGSVGSVLMGGKAMTPEELVKQYGPSYYPAMSPTELEAMVTQFKDLPPAFTEEQMREAIASYAETVKESERPLFVIDSVSGLGAVDKNDPWNAYLTKLPVSLDESYFKAVRYKRRADGDIMFDMESTLSEDYIAHTLPGVTLTGQAAVQDRKLKQASLYGSFGWPKGQMALTQSQLSLGRSVVASLAHHWTGRNLQPDTSGYRGLGAPSAGTMLLEQHTQEMAKLAGTPRMRSTLRAEIREHFGITLYRPMTREAYPIRQTGKTQAVQAFFDYNIGMVARDWLVPLQPISAVGSLDFFREFWRGPRWPDYAGDVMSTKHTSVSRKPKKGHKK